MAYTALITINLPHVNSEARDKFYETLDKKEWNKIPDLTTAWEVIYEGEIKRREVIHELVNDMKTAKAASSIVRVEYAFQIGFSDVKVGKL